MKKHFLARKGAKIENIFLQMLNQFGEKGGF